MAASLPGILLSPIAGVVVDRWDRRWVLILSDTGAALSTLAIWLLLGRGKLEIWHIYVANVINTSLGAFQSPAYLASITMLVPKQHLGRAVRRVPSANAPRTTIPLECLFFSMDHSPIEIRAVIIWHTKITQDLAQSGVF
ncbi:MAG TPA: MFS transporter [Anaerolineales bacterium]|nr:MFS transporter [Anaerolineales bacterium]